LGGDIDMPRGDAGRHRGDIEAHRDIGEKGAPASTRGLIGTRTIIAPFSRRRERRWRHSDYLPGGVPASAAASVLKRSGGLTVRT
jgi:hypothetical protein